MSYAIPNNQFFTVDAATKRLWGNGPWMTEPDHVQWYDRLSGYYCLVRRNPDCGHLCGYVGLNIDLDICGSRLIKLIDGDVHPSRKLLDALQVHGGVTYSERENPDGGDIAFRYIDREGHPAPANGNYLMIGFDCAHAMDETPGLTSRLARIDPTTRLSPFGTYRELDYVRKECELLATQLRTIANNGLEEAMEILKSNASPSYIEQLVEEARQLAQRILQENEHVQ